MQIIDIVKRTPQPQPWVEGDKIPWNDPDFSERMLREHLSQDHDLASRRTETIERHVEWIHSHLLGGKPGKVLDLGCGPGLYASRLAKRGHHCLGIDFSPASIRHAKEQAAREQLSCKYVHGDVRETDFGFGFDLVMFLYGELNVFRPADARAILRKAAEALTPGGILLLEPHRFSAVERLGATPGSWQTAEAGLFAETPHLWLQENAWDETARTATTRFFVIDAATGQVQPLNQTMQAYTDQEYERMLGEAGLTDIEFPPSFGTRDDVHGDTLTLIVARKPTGAQ